MVFISNNQTTEVLQPGEQSFIEVEVATRSKVFGERLQHATQDAFADPLLEPSMASLVRGKPFGQIFPPSSTSQNPEDVIYDFAAVFLKVCRARLPGAADLGWEGR
jgi:hypothetical protein